MLCKPMGMKKCRFKDMHPKGGVKKPAGGDSQILHHANGGLQRFGC